MFWVNTGYRFALPGAEVASGGIILASAIAQHVLSRRGREPYPHLAQFALDPQFYLNDLDMEAAQKICVKLASYPWNSVEGVGKFDSAEMSQSTWASRNQRAIVNGWTEVRRRQTGGIREVVESCLSYQASLNPSFLISPASITNDPATDFSNELEMLDQSIEWKSRVKSPLPLYATVAISDVILRLANIGRNDVLSMISDVITSREVEGVYLVVEMGSERAEAKHCSSRRVLGNLLWLIHQFGLFGKKKVFLNFAGAFSALALGAGASAFATAWYKSLYRLRLADLDVTGRAYPSYWTRTCMTDIHLEAEFDSLVTAGMLSAIADETDASLPLIRAAKSGRLVSTVADWQYRASNIDAAFEHFMRSIADLHHEIEAVEPISARQLRIRERLEVASNVANKIRSAIPLPRRTLIDHVDAWRGAFDDYCSLGLDCS